MKRILLGLGTALALVFLSGCACRSDSIAGKEQSVPASAEAAPAPDGAPAEAVAPTSDGEPGELEEANLAFEEGCVHERLAYGILIPASCETEGRGVYRCEACGKVLQEEVIVPTGHRFR